MKNVKEEVTEIVEEKSKNKKISKIFLWILIVLISMIGIFFLATYIRWSAEIKDKNEILYYKQEEIKIDSLKDFYGSDIDINIKDNEALLMYCTSKYGGICVTGDFSNSIENLFRNPYVIINIVILLDLFLLYFILRDKNIGTVKVYVISTIILLYGCYGIGLQIYKYADYYKLVNDSEYLTNGIIYKGLKTDNDKYFKPVVSYDIDDNNYKVYVDYNVKGIIDSKIDEKITLYYDKKNYENVTPRRDFMRYVLPLIVSIITFVLGIFYMTLLKLKKEEK